LLLGQSSCWLHWLEPTRRIGVSPTSHASANQEFPRSESSFVAALGWYCTPGYFSCEREPSVRADSPFTLSILDQACQPIWPVLNNGASNIPSLRSHSQPASGDCFCGLVAYPPYRPLSRLMSSRYRRAIAIDAHIVGEGLHLTSMTQLSRFSPCRPSPVTSGFGRTGRTVHFSVAQGTTHLFSQRSKKVEMPDTERLKPQTLTTGVETP
jgi:hypothetical protein